MDIEIYFMCYIFFKQNNHKTISVCYADLGDKKKKNVSATLFSVRVVRGD